MSLTVDCVVESCKVKKPPLPPPPKFFWDPSKRDQFIEMLKMQSTKFNEIRESLDNSSCTKEETDLLLKNFTEILYDCAHKCFKMAKVRK